MDGWISLHRKIRKNPIFNDMELLRLWLICLTEATHKEREQPIGRQMVHLEAGQFVTGRFDLVEMYNDGLKRDQQKSPKTIWRWLEALKNGDFLTINSTNKYSVVTILNWDKYQSTDHENDQQVTNKRPTDDQQVTTNNNVNNSTKRSKDKKILKDIYAEKVSLASDEYQKLIKKYGNEDIAKAAISKLSNYKCSSGKKYTSDYHALIGWVFDDFEKKKLIVLNGGQAGEANKRSFRPGESAQTSRVGEGPLARRAMEQVERERHLPLDIDESALPF